MGIPDWSKFHLAKGVLREANSDNTRLALWLPARRKGGYRFWERVSTVPGARITVENGIAATAATSIHARQKVRGFFGKLIPRFGEPDGDRTWLVPDGEYAEQLGEQRTDLLLVWAEDGTAPLDESRVRSRWSKGEQIRQVARNLFVVWGMGTAVPAADEQTDPRSEPPPAVLPRDQADQLLRAARAAGDRRAEAAALTDLGHIAIRGGDARSAIGFLDQALPLARELGVGVSDVLAGLGLAATATGQPKRALELFEEELNLARAGGDRFGEKTALTHMGHAHTALRDFPRAIALYEQALAIAREVGDRHDEADLLWFLTILNADLGQRDKALAFGQDALDVLAGMGSPHIGVFAENLQRYRQGEGVQPNPFAVPGVVVMGSSPMGSPPQGTRWLRQAFTAAKSLAKFFASGLKTVSADTHQARLQTCGSCPHHTGVRCRLCGCFTNLKARLPHEDCPIGKWSQRPDT